MTLPLSGRRILITRAAHQAGKLSDALRVLGAVPVEVPVLEIRPPESFEALDAALRAITGLTSKTDAILSEKKTDVILSESPQRRVEGPAVAFSESSPAQSEGCPGSLALGDPGDHDSKFIEPRYDWLILTSANTVRALVNRAASLGLTLANYPGQVAAIGEATAAAAREAGLVISLIPETYVAESLIDILKNQAVGKRILLVRAAIARDVIPDALRAAGAQVDVVDSYRNVIPEAAPAQLRQALNQGLDAATFTSSSSVTHLAEVAKQANILFPFPNVPAISIGPITTQTLIEHNWPPAAKANPSDIQGLAAAVAKVLS